MDESGDRLSVVEAAKILHLSASRVTQLLRDGKLRRELGGRRAWLIPRAEIERSREPGVESPVFHRVRRWVQPEEIGDLTYESIEERPPDHEQIGILIPPLGRVSLLIQTETQLGVELVVHDLRFRGPGVDRPVVEDLEDPYPTAKNGQCHQDREGGFERRYAEPCHTSRTRATHHLELVETRGPWNGEASLRLEYRGGGPTISESRVRLDQVDGPVLSSAPADFWLDHSPRGVASSSEDSEVSLAWVSLSEEDNDLALEARVGHRPFVAPLRLRVSSAQE